MQPDHRSIADIALDITRHWPNVNYAARPYLAAMFSLHTVGDDYGCDTGESVICYFLANAGSWRGDDAKRIKKELKAIIGER